MRISRGYASIYCNKVEVYLNSMEVFITNFQHFTDVIVDGSYKNQFSLGQGF